MVSEQKRADEALERKKRLRERIAEHRRKHRNKEKILLSEKIAKGVVALKLIENLKSRLDEGLG